MEKMRKKGWTKGSHKKHSKENSQTDALMEITMRLEMDMKNTVDSFEELAMIDPMADTTKSIKKSLLYVS